MTQLNISFEESKKLALLELNWFKERGWHAKVMGGWVRDTYAGVPVKDMDIYLAPKDDQKMEDVEAIAKEFYEARGHEYILHKKERRQDAPDDSPYNEFLIVFQSQNVAEGDFPVDLIFSPAAYEHPGYFDIGICEHQFWIPAYAPDEVHHHMSRDAKRDVENKTLTILRVEDGLFDMLNGYRDLSDEQFERGLARMLAHLERLKAKYPEHKVVMDLSNTHMDRRATRLYTRLTEENYFGNPGPLLPTEASIAERDAVRQLDREELIRVVRGEDDQPRVQAGEAPVLNRARVQPGLFDLEGDEFVRRVLEQARQLNQAVEDGPARAERRLRAAATPAPAPRNVGPRGRFGDLR